MTRIKKIVEDRKADPKEVEVPIDIDELLDEIDDVDLEEYDVNLENIPSLAEAERPFFRLGTWRHLTQWQCTLCPWDTLNGEQAFWMHYAERHGVEA